MAYLNLLAAVSLEQVAMLRRENRYFMKPSLVVRVSHLIALQGWVDAQPLQMLLSRALDGGEVLEASLWHPLRVPIYHSPDAVRQLAETLAKEWIDFLAKNQLAEDDWYRIEIGKALALFNHAAKQAEGVASFLDSPGDVERARRVRIPLAATR